MIRLFNEIRFRLAGEKPQHAPVSSLNDFFDRIVFLNLDRRPDRRRNMEEQQAHFGFSATRISAIDGQEHTIHREYEGYLERYADELPAGRPKKLTDKVTNHSARVALENRQNGGPCLGSSGALAYLRTQALILEEAIESDAKSLLILDDDVLFHKELNLHFNRSIARLPHDWRILQLGTLRYNWSRWSTQYHSAGLLQQGRSIGSHAVGLHRDALPELLDLVKKLDSPFDIGPLSTLACMYKSRSFVCIPQLCVQSFADTDIQLRSKVHFTETERLYEKVRWNRSEYWPLELPHGPRMG